MLGGLVDVGDLLARARGEGRGLRRSVLDLPDDGGGRAGVDGLAEPDGDKPAEQRRGAECTCFRPPGVHGSVIAPAL